MAEKKFSDLTAKGAALADTDLVAISESTGGGAYTSKSVTGANIKALVTDANLTTTDVTTNDVSTSKHGFAPKAPNDTTKFLRGDGTWAVPAAGSSSGKFGIADSTGAYTYYTTLQASITAASAGQTVEMFTDYTESSVTAITLKNGVNINGNGHTYNYTASTGNCFIDNGVAVTCTIQNLIVDRTSHTSGNILTFTSSSSSVDYIGSKFYLTSASGSSAVASLTGTHRNLWVKGIGTSLGGITGGILINCYSEVTGSGNGITQLSPNSTDCTGISVSGRGFYVYEDGTLTRCFGKATSGYGIFCETSGSNIILYNCLSISSSGTALYMRGTKAYNNICISSSGVGISCNFGNNQIFNTSIKSASSIGITGASGDILNNSSIIADGAQCVSQVSTRNSTLINGWNNASGHAYISPSASSDICNNVMSVTNTSANCIYNASAVSPKYANNAFKGATTPVNANITQGISNTQDNQGNILL
jgi:hypothetical protein